MKVIHVASDVFVGTVAQAVTFWHMRKWKWKLLDESIISLANNSLASAPTASISTYSCFLQSIQLQWGSSLVRVLTHHNYCGNHGHHDCQVALAFRHIQWHNNIDHYVGCHVGCLLLRDKDDTNQWYHKACEEGNLHVQTSVVRGTWCHCCFSSPPRLTFGTRVVVVMTLVTNMAFILWPVGLPRLVAIAAWTTWWSGKMTSRHHTLQTQV